MVSHTRGPFSLRIIDEFLRGLGRDAGRRSEGGPAVRGGEGGGGESVRQGTDPIDSLLNGSFISELLKDVIHSAQTAGISVARRRGFFAEDYLETETTGNWEGGARVGGLRER